MEHQLATKSMRKEQAMKTPSSFALQSKSPKRSAMHPMLRLQRAVGNQAVQNLVRGRALGQPLGAATPDFMGSRSGQDFNRIPTYTSAAGAIQTKLAINKPGDEYEREADRVADQVLAAPAQISRPVPRHHAFSALWASAWACGYGTRQRRSRHRQHRQTAGPGATAGYGTALWP